MNRIIVTIGTSLLSSACWEFDPIISYCQADTEPDKRSVESNNRRILEDKTERELIDSFKEYIWMSKNPLRDLPAEMATLCLLVNALNEDTDEKKRLQQYDEIYLLHSGNDDGNKCARIQQALLKKLLPGVVIERESIPELDPAEKNQLHKGLQKIWDFCTAKISGDHLKLYLNLTGGYKVTSMLCSILASWCRADLTIVYGHESADFAKESLFTLSFIYGETVDSFMKFGYFDDTLNSFVDYGPGQ